MSTHENYEDQAGSSEFVSEQAEIAQLQAESAPFEKKPNILSSIFAPFSRKSNKADVSAEEIDQSILSVIGKRPKGIAIIGDFAPRTQYIISIGMVASFLLASGAIGFVGTRAANFDNERVSISTRVQMLSQRLSSSSQLSVDGDLSAINRMRQTNQDLVTQMNLLTKGDPETGMGPVTSAKADELLNLERNAISLGNRIENLLKFSGGLTQIDKNSGRIEAATTQMSASADRLQTYLLENGAPTIQRAAADHLRILAERIRRNGVALLRSPDATTESQAQITADLKNFGETLKSLTDGKPEIGMSPVTDANSVEVMKDLAARAAELKKPVSYLEKTSNDIVNARRGQASLVFLADSGLRDATRLAEQLVQDAAGDRNVQLVAAASLLGALLSIFLVVLINNRLTRIDAWNTLLVNKKNEKDIISFMGNIFPLEDGDLTVSFTDDTSAMEGITGGIRSSVNEAVTSLRNAVTEVKSTATDVTNIVQSSVSSTRELEDGNKRQSTEIDDVVLKVGQLATAIAEVTEKTLQATKIAADVRSAAAEGESVVGKNNEKMADIRAGMQEVLKSVKHSGETSHEISSIVEAIDGITDRTQIIAVNASLEAAKAGAAGAPFKVLAGEVNRLAEQSKELQLTISALTQRNQGETAATIKLVEQATDAVVEGAKLSEIANGELRKISAIAEEIARFMDEIRNQSETQSISAEGVSASMERLSGLSKEFQQSVVSVVSSVEKIDQSMGSLQTTVSEFITEKDEVI